MEVDKEKKEANNCIWWHKIFMKMESRIVDPQTLRLLILRRAEQKKLDRKAQEIDTLKAELKNSGQKEAESRDQITVLSASCNKLTEDLAREQTRLEEQVGYLSSRL